LNDVNILRISWKLEEPLLREEYSDWESFPGLRYWQERDIKLPRYKDKRHEKLWNKYKSKIPEEGIEKIMWNLSDLEDVGVVVRDELTELYKYELVTNLFEYFRYQVIELRKKYKRPPNFDQIIGAAILFNEVLDNDYVTCEIGIENPDVESLPYFEESKLIINFYPLTTADEIESVFEQRKQQLINEYERIYIGGSIVDYDTMGNIKRDREWYWLRLKNGLSWSGLHREITAHSREVITQDGVVKAVKVYAKRLTMEI
jgi:hypothetical protein